MKISSLKISRAYSSASGSKAIWQYKYWPCYAHPLTAGLLIALSLPPWGWWPLLILGLTYWLYLLDTPSWHSRFMYSFLVSLAWFLPSLLWIWDLTAIGYLVVVVIFSVGYGIGGVLIPPSYYRWLSFPAMLVLIENIRWRWPFGGVPLSTLSMSLVDSFFNHTIRFLGPLFLVFLAAVLAVGLSALLKREYPLAGVIGLGFILATVFLGFAPTTTTGEKINVAIVQGGGPQRVRVADSNTREVFERHLTASQVVQTPVDLVVWPENVVNVNSFANSQEEAELAQLAIDLNTHLYVGVVEDLEEDVFANYSVLFSPTGAQVDLYEKVRRVPFGEYVPLRSLIEPFAPNFLPDSQARIGKNKPTINFASGSMANTLGTVISWEIFFEDRVREAARAGAEIILNPTNNSSYWLSIVQSQQIASSKLRAMETGLWVVQAAPTGFSAFVDSTGSVVQKIPIGQQEVIQMSVELRSGKTIATRVGVWPMVGLSLALILFSGGVYIYRRFD